MTNTKVDFAKRFNRDFKVRLGNPSAGRGKRGGFRVVYYIHRKDSVLLLTLYAKTQREDIPPEQIRRIIEEYTLTVVREKGFPEYI